MPVILNLIKESLKPATLGAESGHAIVPALISLPYFSTFCSPIGSPNSHITAQGESQLHWIYIFFPFILFIVKNKTPMKKNVPIMQMNHVCGSCRKLNITTEQGCLLNLSVSVAGANTGVHFNGCPSVYTMWSQLIGAVDKFSKCCTNCCTDWKEEKCNTALIG